MNCNEVIKLHLAGDLDGAEKGYRKLISQNSKAPPVAYGNLALICMATSRLDEALELLRTSLKLDSNNPDTYLNLGVALRQHGMLDDAINAYRKAQELNPSDPKAHNNLGCSLLERGELEHAVDSLRKALKLNPNYPDAHFNLGNALRAHGNLQEAISSYHQALKLGPSPKIYLNLGNALKALGNLSDAISSFRKATELDPKYAEAHNNLGYALQEQGMLEDAISSLQKALELKPDYWQAHLNLGNVFKAQRRFEDAISAYQKVLELNPENADAYNNLGATLKDQGKLEDAVSSFQKELGIRTAGLATADLIKKLCRLLLELEKIPAIYQDASKIETSRQYYTSCLNEAALLVSNEQHTFTAEETRVLRTILFKLTNFYLAYQQQNDRDIQISYSRLATKILAPEISPYLPGSAGVPPALGGSGKPDPYITRSVITTVGAGLARPSYPLRSPDGKIRLGIASELLKQHNGTNWAYDWLANLPAKDYEFFLYSLNGTTDEVTQKFAALGTYRWLPFRESNYHGSLKVIKDDNLDVFLIPDVGMTASSRIISLVRLAPIQCVAWGHPMTTGSSNIDYYLSSELMETEESDDHYSEQLVRLPNIGLHLEHLPVPEALTRSDFSIPEHKIVYGSVQSLFKYLPQYDFVYTAIAKQVPNAFFVFVAHESDLVTTMFEERLKNEFELSGLNFTEYVKILPRMQLSTFTQLLGVLDVNLDSIGWTGGLTTMRSLEMNCPMVTLPGEFMRGRHSYAMLKMIGIDELIVSSLEEYVSLASRLGLDSELRSSLVDKIKAQKHKLFNDTQCIEFLDVFFKSKVKQIRDEETSSPHDSPAGQASLTPTGDAEAYYNLGITRHEKGDLEDAVSSFRKALELKPNYPEAFFKLGDALKDQGELDAAISAYGSALKLKPNFADAYINLGIAFQEQGKTATAVASYKSAIKLSPNSPEAYNNLGLVLQRQGKSIDAISAYNKALELRSSNPEAHDNLGTVLKDQGKLDDAMSSYIKALEIRTAHLGSASPVRKLGGLLLELERIPTVYRSSSELDECRRHYIGCLTEASELLSANANTLTAQETAILRGVFLGMANFYLAYQGFDDKELQVAYCRLATGILRPEIGEFLTPRPMSHPGGACAHPAPGGSGKPDPYIARSVIAPVGAGLARPSDGPRIRLGVASQFLRNHSGAYWAYDWLANLPQEDYEFFLYSLNGRTDEVTENFASLGTYLWLPFSRTNYQTCLKTIEEDKLDILLIPDVGMTSSSRVLSLIRLAPIQCVAWGHPITTGSSNVDYYLSSELMETEESDNHYSEQLVRLPNIGVNFSYPEIPENVPARSELGIPQNRIVYGSVQSLFKYLPQHDFVYPAIAKQVPKSFFIFVAHDSDYVTDIFRERLKESFEKSGLSFKKYVKILPRMSLSRFTQLLGALDIVLDSIGFTGGITTMRSLAMNCPVVTLPGEFMRGRLSYGMLKMIGLDELIASSLEEYISLSGRLGLDAELRASVVDKIKAQKHRLFNDSECVAFLDSFFKSKVDALRRVNSEVARV